MVRDAVPNLDLVVCVIPGPQNVFDSPFECIKRWGDVTAGVATQVLSADSVLSVAGPAFW